MKLKYTIEIECGEKTCASEPGRFCGWFGVGKFGWGSWCMLFDEKLFDSTHGWVERCEKCLEEVK